MSTLNKRCRLEFDGYDTDGTPWSRCLTHTTEEYLVIGTPEDESYTYCEGHRPVPYGAEVWPPEGVVEFVSLDDGETWTPICTDHNCGADMYLRGTLWNCSEHADHTRQMLFAEDWPNYDEEDDEVTCDDCDRTSESGWGDLPLCLECAPAEQVCTEHQHTFTDCCPLDNEED